MNPTEHDILAAITTVAAVLGPKFAFGPFEASDIQQEVAVMCLEALPRYRPEVGSLEAFFFANARNRCLNLKRDRLRRADAPCRRCSNGQPCGEDGDFCMKYREWHERNEAKASLMLTAPAVRQAHDQADSSNLDDEVQTKELLRLIDIHLPVEMRADWLLIRAGKSIAKNRREAVVAAVREILDDDLPAEGQER